MTVDKPKIGAVTYGTYILSLILLQNLCVSDVTARICSYQGRTYHQGDAWVDAAVCDACSCDQYGVHCFAGRDRGGCPMNGTNASPGDPVCLYDYRRAYTIGDEFHAVDGCNTCRCMDRGMVCTTKACSAHGFATGSVKPLFGNCIYNNMWYIYRTQWLATDGCNTCYCATIGNYQGHYICTGNQCPGSQTSSPIG